MQRATRQLLQAAEASAAQTRSPEVLAEIQTYRESLQVIQGLIEDNIRGMQMAPETQD